MPDVLGVQEAELSQINYLNSQMGEAYEYYGVPRDLAEGESMGIYLRRGRFDVK